MENSMGKVLVVSVCGLIGSGKSTLVSNLANNDGYIEFQEPVESNPFLELYYDDPTRWSYAMQVNLLFERYKQSQEAYLQSLRGEIALLDSTIYSDAAFGLVQKECGYFTDKEYKSYINMHQVLATQIAYPDIMFWLELSPEDTMERIKKRSRNCESGIPIDYLEKLYNSYQIILDKLKAHTNVVSIDARYSAEDVYKNVSSYITWYRDKVSDDDIKYL